MPLSAHQAANRWIASAWDAEALPASEAIPWADALRVVLASNVGALVYAVTARQRGALPDEARQALAQAFYGTAAANARCLQQLGQVQEALAAVGIPLLLLKGAALAQTLYSDVALRLIGDLDVAVRPEDVAAARQVLLGMGYTPGQLEERPGSLQKYSNQELFAPPAPHSAPLELHWHILDVPYYLHSVPMAWFWEHSEPLLPQSELVRVLDPVANLLYLPAHLALHHRYDRLHGFCDLALLVARHGAKVDWHQIAAEAQRFELLTALRETLGRLAQRWPTLPLGEALAAAAALAPTANDARLYRLLTAEPRNTSLHLYTTLVSLPGARARARFLWTQLFPEPRYMVARYGIRSRWQLPGWYLVRLAGGLWRLLGKAPRLWRAECGRR
ncbi:MAG: nucleotidyltransferase family protein [Anaerolineae bacterium]|jgi:hypothetical protein